MNSAQNNHFILETPLVHLCYPYLPLTIYPFYPSEGTILLIGTAQEEMMVGTHDTSSIKSSLSRWVAEGRGVSQASPNSIAFFMKRKALPNPSIKKVYPSPVRP